LRVINSLQRRRLTSHYRSYIRTKFGERAFLHAGPAMPEKHIRAKPDTRVSGELLKTHLFNV